MSVERERVWTTDRFLEKILLATDGSEDAALAGRVAVDLVTAIGYWYEDFEQVSDGEVVELLERSRAADCEGRRE